MFNALGSREVVFGALLIALIVALMVPPSLRRNFRSAFLLGGIYGFLITFGPKITLGEISEQEWNAIALVCGGLAVARVITVIVIDIILSRGGKAPITQLTRDILHTVVYVVTFIIALRAGGIAPGSILATGTVVTAILGFALQETLGNLAAGVAIQIEKPIRPGDWIRLDKSDPVGRVIETNWRAVSIQTDDKTVFVIPNSQFSKTPFTNFSRPGDSSRRNIYITVPHDIAPAKVQEALLAACASCPEVLKDPAPSAITWAFDQLGVTYWLRFFIADFAARDRVFGLVSTRIWYHFHREKIPFATPVQQHFVRKINPKQVIEEEKEVVQDRRAAIDSVDFLAPLPEPAKQKLAELGHRKLYAPEEVIVSEHDSSRDFFMIRSGAVSLRTRGIEVDRLDPGDCFGELALLTGSNQNTRVVALCETQVFVIDEPLFRDVLKANPAVASEISKILAERQSRLAETPDSGPASIQDMRNWSSQFLEKISDLFGLKD